MNEIIGSVPVDSVTEPLSLSENLIRMREQMHDVKDNECRQTLSHGRWFCRHNNVEWGPGSLG